MQMVEITKAFSYNSKIIVMDEPTSSLTEKEVSHLFKIIAKLKDKGCGVVYISHKMEEIKGIIMISSEMPELLGVTDRILVMSNGRVVRIVNTNETNQEEILTLASKYL